ncbi:MAG: aminotransferase class III-fold pyridoxal phosphate-dependent enzyme [Hyphomicrobiales bacterium]
MLFLKPSRPDVAIAEVERVLSRQYGLEGTLNPLYGERDQGFRLDGADGRWLVKVVNAAEPDSYLEAQIAALRHIASVAPDVAAPRVAATVEGHGIARFTDAGNVRQRMIVLSWVEGTILGGVAYTPALMRDLGRTLARLGRALRGFFHPGLRARALLWDVREIGELAPHTALIADPGERRLAERAVARFLGETLPRLEGLALQAIHNDAGGHNVIVSADARGVSGIIDFGDMVHASLAQDLSTTLSDALMGREDFADHVTALVEGYRAVTPLGDDDLAVLWSMTAARAALTPIITAWRRANDPGTDDYMDVHAGEAARFIDALETLGEEKFVRLARGEPLSRPRPADGAMPSLLRRRVADMGEKMQLFYDPPLHLVRGEGVWLYDPAGRRYLDVYNNVPHVGHCHPHVVEAVRRQVGLLNTNTRYLFTQVLDYAERLIETMPRGDWKCLFVNSGSEANDVAWRIAKAYSGNRGALCMEYAYHGITDAIADFTPSADITPVGRPHMRYLIAPDGYRGPYPAGHPDFAAAYAAYAEEAIADLDRAGYGTAAFLVDSAFLTNGVLTPPPEYMQRVVAAVRAAGGVFIADEVQSGFGRLGGELWGHRTHGVEADIMTIGKPAGNGFPLGVIVARTHIVDKFLQHTSFFSTFGGNNVACAAGVAVLDVIERDRLVDNAAEVGAYFRSLLETLQQRHPVIGDVRGRGLAIGVELVEDRTTRKPATKLVKPLLNAVRDRGVLIGSEGVHGNVLKLRPPIVFAREHCEIAADALDRSLAACAG